MRTLLKRVTALAILGALAAVVAYVTIVPPAVEKGGGRRARMAGNGPVPVLDAPARIADVPVYLNGVGTAKARNTVTVRPQVDGKIISINFREGQEVKRGDVLAKIDPATYQAQLDQAVAKKALDEVQLNNAQRDLERYTQLGGNVVAQKTIDTQRALVAQFTAQVKQDDAAIDNARAVLAYTTITSPLDGRTGIRMVDEGNLVRASDAGIVVITEVQPISVLFTLPQQQLAQVIAALAKGPVVAEAFNADGRTLLDTGTLQVVDNQVDQTTGTVRMKAEFANAKLQLWSGQFVNVRLLIDTMKQVVVIPTPAVQRGPSGAFAYVVQEERATLRPVTVSLQSETVAVIDKGISASERVITTGFARLKDGAAVTVGEAEEPATSDAPSGTPKPQAKAESKGDGRAKMRTACAADLQKLCPTAERGSAIRTCLQDNASKLSDDCKSAAAAMKPREAKAEGRSTQ